MTAKDIIQKYIAFFEKRGHKRIPNASLVPENDPTTLFTSSGMQPLVPYLLGEAHPQGKRLVNVQNCFRAQDIDEVGDNRHITFFRMLGNWSLGGYFKARQLPWFFEFLTEELSIDPERLYVSVFKGYETIPTDTESEKIWRDIFEKAGIDPKNRIFFYGADKNWWSRAGGPKEMPEGEIGGPDSEVFYDFQTPHDEKYGEHCHINCSCGRYLEIGNSVFMQYVRKVKGFEPLPKQNVDFGGGLERLIAVTENQQDIFQTSLFAPIISTIENTTTKNYGSYQKEMRIICDHLISSVFMISNNVTPSNKEQGYILRRLLRRGLDNFYNMGGTDTSPIIESIIERYKETDPDLPTSFEKIKNTILEEKEAYETTLKKAKDYIFKKYQMVGDELKGKVKISPDDAFFLYSSHGLSPTQIKNLGYVFDEQKFAEKMRDHQALSRKGAKKKFAGGLADHKEKTIMGHTATHLMHQAIIDVLGNYVHQTGSNITSERIRFDFNYEKKITDEQLNKVKEIVNEKIRENLRVYFEIMPLKKAKEIGAIGLFDEKYSDTVKIYFIGGGPSSPSDDGSSRQSHTRPYSIEFCGGPHVDFTKKLKKFKIIKQENLGKNQKRLYAIVG